MASITPTLTINPTTMANNWKTYTAQAGPKWLAKYLAPRSAFNADPTGWQTAWYNGVQAAHAAGTPAKHFGAASVLNKAATAASTYGQTNYVNAATNKAGNYAASAGALATALSNARAHVAAMPNGTFEQRQQRMIAWATQMHAVKGTIKNAG